MIGLSLEVAGVALAIQGPPSVLAALAGRFPAFVHRAGPAALTPAAWLEVRSADAAFAAVLDIRDAHTLAVESRRHGELGIVGTATGGFDVERRQGWLERAGNLGELDALIRLALSIVLPLEGGLLLHAAALSTPDGGALILCGASGAGKSTAARSFADPLSDELAVVRGDQVAGTPYWNGRARHAPLRRLVLLERGTGEIERVGGGRAVAQLSAHVVRYAPHPEVDAAVLALCVRLCERLPVERIACPEGAGFLPFLSEALGLEVVAGGALP
jgi:hypothetical protein